MRKILFGLLTFVICWACTSKTDNSSTNVVSSKSSSVTIRSKAYLISQPLLIDHLDTNLTVNFSPDVVFEQNGLGKCILLGKMSTDVADYTYKIWLDYDDKNWKSQSSWLFTKIIIENAESKSSQTFYNKALKPKNDFSSSVVGVVDGIDCINIERNDIAIRMSTSKKLTEKQIQTFARDNNLEDKLLYFHLPNKTERGKEYAYKAKDLILIYE